jgi:hypothetical protein
VPVAKNGITGSKSSSPAASPGARRSMRIAAVVGPVCGVLCIVLGVLKAGQGHGIVTLTLGCVLSVFWTLMIPAVRRSGKL